MQGKSVIGSHIKIFAIILLVIEVIGILMISSTVSTNASTKSQLKSTLRQSTTETIRKIYYKDFDKDGKKEAIAITSKEKDNLGYVFGKVWYVNSKQCQCLGESTFSIYKENIKLCKVKKGYILYFESGAGGSSTKSNAYFLGKNAASELSNVYCGIKYQGKNKFTQVEDTFDGMYDSGINGLIVHTYKQYWFYWNGREMIEYGGIKISQKQLERKKGGKAVLKKIKKEKGKVTSIYYRSNKIININYKVGKKDYSNYNITMKLSKGKLKYCKINNYGKNSFEKARDSGVYIANLSANVNYPKKFK